METQITTSIDTSSLEVECLRIEKFGRRTVRQQAITSAAFIALDAQKNTPSEEVGDIDSDLQVSVTGYTKTGRRSRAKRPFKKVVSAQSSVVNGARQVPIGILITMARGNPNSEFNQLTGSRWALNDRPGPGPGYMKRIGAWVKANLQKMVMARHSSISFLQHGWANPIRAFLTDKDYYAGRSRSQARAQQVVGHQNRLDLNELGEHKISAMGDSVLVSGTNAVGSDGISQKLSESHRSALMRKGVAPMQAAVDKEAASLAKHCDKMMMEQCQVEFRNLQ